MRNLPMPVRRVPTHGDVTGCLVAVCVHSACAIVLFLAAPSLGRHAALARVPAFALVVTAAMLLATAVVNERRFRQSQARPTPDPFTVQRHDAFLGRPVPVVNWPVGSTCRSPARV